MGGAPTTGTSRLAARRADQLPNFERHLGPAGSPSRLPAPEGAESSTMPSYNRAITLLHSRRAYSAVFSLTIGSC